MKANTFERHCDFKLKFKLAMKDILPEETC